MNKKQSVLGKKGHPKCFISYRIKDAGQSPFWLARDLAEAFGTHSVFVDKHGIQGGEAWRQKILKELVDSTVVLALIGPNWLTIQDNCGRRRLDIKDDWVRMELTYSLKNGKTVIPILVEQAEMPLAEALPLSLRTLEASQAMKLHPSSFDQSHMLIIERLTQLGFKRQQHIYAFSEDSAPHKYTILDESEIESFLKKHPSWSRESRKGPNGTLRDGLTRDFAFESFKSAQSFMRFASRGIVERRHYPEWTNSWRTVRVWFSTRDVNFKISNYDIKMALYFEKMHASFQDYLESCSPKTEP